MASFLLNPTLILGLLATHSLAVPAPSSENSYVAKRATAALSCWDNASNGETFIAKNAEWEIICGKDYVGGDMGASWPASFEECINDCDTVQGCVDVSFVWPNACYKKNKLNTAIDNVSVWTARKKVTVSSDGTSTEPKAPSGQDVTCQDKASDGVKYTSKKGNFLIECGFDHYGGDMGSSNTDTFAACIEDCAATDGCVDVSYVWGTCYKKNTLNEGGAAGHVWSAKLVTDETGSTGTGTSTDTTKDTTAPITCPSSNGKTPSITSGGTYEITCGTDYFGGDFKSLETTSFELCLEACDNNDACQAVAYVAPSCYLKNEVNNGVSAAHVWGAIVKKPAKDTFAFPTVVNQELEAGATESLMAEVMTLPSPPLATLGPVSPPGVDMGGLGVLTPEEKTALWFGGSDDAMKDDESGAVTVRITVDYKYPSIILDHSIYIKNVDCASGSLQAKFDNLIAFTHAADTWPATAPLLFITSATSCGNGDQNSFWLAQSVTFDQNTNTFSASGATVELADVYNEMDIDFGKIELQNSTSNSTTSTDEDGLSCGKPSSPFLDDLPAVACGASFDSSLDEQLGYYAANGDDEEHVLVSAGVDSSDSNDISAKRDLARRGWLSNLAKKVVQVAKKAVVTVVKQAAQTVVTVAKTAAKVAVAVVQTTVKVGVALAVNAAKLAVFVVTGNYDNSLTLPIDLTGTSLSKTTPWDDTTGFKFYDYRPEREGAKWKASKVNLARVASEFKLLPGEKDPEPGVELWCVDCGVKGKFIAKGSLSATPLSGLKKAQVDVSGNMYVGAFLGVNAFTKYEKTIRKDLFVKGLPGWEIPKIVSLGPRAILGAQATFSIEAEGQLLTGASLNWPAFQAHLDFVDSHRSSQSGWVPQVTRKFDAHGELTATAALGLPVTLSFGINILDGRFEKAVNLTDIPAITAEAKLEFDVGTSKNQFGGDDCQGIAWDIALTNEVRIDVPKSEGWKLGQWKPATLAKGCIGRTRPETPASSSSALPTSTTPATSTAPTPTSTALTCPAAEGKTFTGTGSNKNQYTIGCNKDAQNSDIGSVSLNTFDECMNYCDTLPSCVGVAWGPTVKTCWPKNAFAAQSVASNPQDPRHVAFIPKPTTLQCPDADGKKFTDSGSNKNEYTIVCNKDAAGADITWGYRDSFESCMNWCGTNSQCVGIVYAPKRTDGITCWLKNGYPALIPNPSPSTDPIHSAMTVQPTLSIISMFYADRDITSYAKQNVARGSQLVIDTNNIVGWANGDPWPGNQKSISMLFSYGKELRTFVVAGGTGTFVLNPGPASSQPYVQVVPGYESMSGVSNINIVAVVYGRSQITSRSVYQNMYNAIRTAGGRWQYTNDNFQSDTWVGIGKTGVIWYKNTDNGYFIANPARENNYNFFQGGRWSKRQELPQLPESESNLEPSLVDPTDLPKETSFGTSPAQITPDPIVPETPVEVSSDSSNETSVATPTVDTASETSLETSATASATSESFPQLTVSNSTANATSNSTDVNFANFEIVDTTNSLKLNPSKSGNLFLSLVGDSTDISNLTSGSFNGDPVSKTVIGDSSDRYLHYYPDVLASSGASRLRLAAWNKLPKGAKLITLSQVEVEGETLMLGIDTRGNYLWPFVCGIKGQLNKIFLVNDPVNGGAALQKDNMKFTVTGGEAYSCEPVALMVKASA